MSREIKFRVWDIENKEMLNVQELDFEPTFYGGRIAIRPDQYSDYFDPKDMILMQYTGLHDKNGKEIYEGDIVKANWFDKTEVIGEIYFSMGCFILANSSVSDNQLFIFKNLEVIGNIYENSKLLEDK